MSAREREVAPGLHAFSVDPEAAKEEWLRRQLEVGRVAGALGQSRIFTYLSTAAPGLAELVTIGEVLGARPARAATQPTRLMTS